MVLVKQWSQLLVRGRLRRSCIALTCTHGLRQPVRRRTESKVVHSPFSDVHIPSYLIEEGVWANLERWPDKDALVCAKTNRKFTYHETRLACKRFAACLIKRGMKPGQVLGIMLPNIPEFAVSALGAIEAGLVITTINPVYTPFEIAHQLKDSGATGIVTIPELLAKVLEAKRLVSGPEDRTKFIVSVNMGGPKPNDAWDFDEMLDSTADVSVLKSTRRNTDPAILPYSSGTTGLSKGVLLSHRNVMANIAQTSHPEISFIMDTTEKFQEVAPSVLPFFHVYGLSLLLIGLFRGCKLVSIPNFETELFLNILKNHKATILYAVPPIVQFLGQSKSVNREHFEHLRMICNGAGPVKETDAQRVLDKAGNKNLHFCQAFGMTELSPAAFMTRVSSKNDYLTVGSPIPNTKAKVVDPSDSTKELGSGELGEILINGPQVMLGYHNNPEATANTLSPDGWLSTGDIGYYNENQDFYIVDRLKELIKVQGYQVPPAELEGLLRTHPSVTDAAVIGVPDDRTGEAPLAFVVLNANRPAVGEEEIKQFVAERVAPYKRIAAGVRFVDVVPKSAAGKILRRTLKDEYTKEKASTK